MNLVLHGSICGALIVLAIAAGMYRRWLENHCDNLIHLHNDSHDATLVAEQSNVCKRLDMLSKVTTALIVAAIVYAVAIAAIAIYMAWNNPGTT
jgi:hypothetical protein